MPTRPAHPLPLRGVVTVADLPGGWPELIADHTIGKLNDAEFEEFWHALGIVVRLASRKVDAPAREAGTAAEPPDPPQRDPASTTSASAERAPQWDHDRRAPVRAFGFGKDQP